MKLTVVHFCAAILLLGMVGREPDPRPGAVAYRAADAIVVAKCPQTVSEGVVWFVAAAADLTNVLSKVTGRKIPLYAEGTEPKDAKAVIYFGDTAAAKADGVGTDGLRNMDFRIKTVPGKTYLVAKTGTAANCAMVRFLAEKADYWFLTIAGDDPYTVKPELTIPVEDRIVRPAFYMHKIYDGFTYLNGSSRTEEMLAKQLGAKAAMWKAYQRRNLSYGLEREYEGFERVSQQKGLSVAHSQFCYLPPEKYFKDHPDWYSLRDDGRRSVQANGGGQICMSSPEARKEIVRNMLEFIRRDREQFPTDYPRIYDFTQMDNDGGYFCHCDGCKELLKKYSRCPGAKDQDAQGGNAGLQLDFVNAVAAEVAKVYPDVWLRTFAYSCAQTAPVGISPAENVIVWYADLYTYSSSCVPLATTKINAYMKGVFEDWKKISGRMELWDYVIPNDDFPILAVDATHADARFFRENGVSRYFAQHEYMHQPFWELDNFVYCQSVFDPDQDLERLVSIFCRSYGENAAEMHEAINFFRRAIQDGPAASQTDWFAKNLPWRNTSVYAKMIRLVKPCYDREANPLRRARLACVLASFYRDLAVCCRRSPGQEANALRATEQAKRYTAEDFALTSMPDGSAARYRERYERALRKFDIVFRSLPDELKDVPQSELVFVDSDFTFQHPMSGKKVEDASSEVCGRVLRWRDQYDVKPPFKADIISHEFQRVYDLDIPTANQDGRYHWYKLGTGYIGRVTKFHCPTAVCGEKIHPARTPSTNLSEFYKDIDGIPAERNPNWYELWVSCKWSPKSATNDDDGFYVDRIAMRRVKPSLETVK